MATFPPFRINGPEPLACSRRNGSVRKRQDKKQINCRRPSDDANHLGGLHPLPGLESL